MVKFFVDYNKLMVPEDRQFVLEEWIENSPFEHLVGLNIVEAKDGSACLTLPFTVKLANGGGVMHGGALTTLADTAVAMAMKSLLAPETFFATTELSMTFVAPVRSGVVTALAEVTPVDERIYHGTCVLRIDDQSIVANFTSTFKVARRQVDMET